MTSIGSIASATAACESGVWVGRLVSMDFVSVVSVKLHSGPNVLPVTNAINYSG